jgi:hypothetical protein
MVFFLSAHVQQLDYLALLVTLPDERVVSMFFKL